MRLLYSPILLGHLFAWYIRCIEDEKNEEGRKIDRNAKLRIIGYNYMYIVEGKIFNLTCRT